ncbi:MAG: hypothetical protein IJR13_05955 [Bacteroidales bacterium]|nr:hypothetical protein [Bacteroidales bacterium]
MRKTILFIIAAMLLCSACKKKVDEIDFSGKVVGGCECTGTGMGQSISQMDWGYFVALDKPEAIGSDYIDADRNSYSNVVILYGTHTRLTIGNTISGKLYLDKDYASSYCNYRPQLGVPQAVCSSLD